VGDALDNAVAESFFATLQTELLDRHRWTNRKQLAQAIFEWIEGFYNQQRRHSTPGHARPRNLRHNPPPDICGMITTTTPHVTGEPGELKRPPSPSRRFTRSSLGGCAQASVAAQLRLSRD
jgi:hypothetical protein